MADEQFAEQFLKDWGYFYKHERDYKKAEKALLKLLEQVRGQAQAEVLAACVAKLERDARNCFAAADKADAEGRGGTYESWRRTAAQYQNIAEDFKQFQPAAKDLEALLRDTETKAIDGQQELMSCGHAAANLQPSDETAEFCVVCELLREARETAVAWGRLDQHKEDCEDIDCKYARAQGKRIKGCPKYLALQRQLAELEKARAEGKG